MAVFGKRKAKKPLEKRKGGVKPRPPARQRKRRPVWGDEASVAKRISEIYDISLEELNPDLVLSKKKINWLGTTAGSFSPRTGAITTVPGSPAALSHEKLHRDQELLTRQSVEQRRQIWLAQEAILRGEERKTRRRATLKNRLEQSRESRFNEYLPTFDKAPESKLWAIGPYRLLFRFAPTTILLLEIASLANPGARKAYSGYFAAVIAAKAASLVYIQAGLNHCFKKHGADAFILLSVKPPKKHRVERIWFWERQMIRQGYLSKEGGLTRKGVELVRELQPREVILERVNRWKAVQEVMLEREKAQKEKALE